MNFLLLSLTLAAAIPRRADAFAVATRTTRSSFVAENNFLAASNEKKDGLYYPISSGPGIATSRGNTALQMALFDRFMRVSKANLNKVLSSMEAPEKIINQAVEDMQSDLVKIRQNYADITASQRKLEKGQQDAQAVADNWYARAQLALRNGNELLAKEALVRREQQLEVAQSIQSELDVQNSAIDRLYEAMKLLEGKINDAKKKKAQYIARAKTAETTQKVNNMLSGLGTGKTSMDAFHRMEEKIEALEAAAEASIEMSALATGGKSAALDIENEFLRLEGSASVDDELQKMKQNLLKSSSSPFLPSSQIGDSDIESKLEAMKQDATKTSNNWD